MVASLSLAVPVSADGGSQVEYRVDVYKAIGEIGKVSAALSMFSKGADGVHLAALVADAIADTGTAAAGTAAGAVVAGGVVGGVLGFVGGLASIAEAYQEGREYHARQYALRGFSRGAVMGADNKVQLLKEYFGFEYIPPLGQPEAHNAAKGAYVSGLIIGAHQGASLLPSQKGVFWRDLGSRMGDQSDRGSPKDWGRTQEMGWYVDVAIQLWKEHLI
jgi:hypothetical protein